MYNDCTFDLFLPGIPYRRNVLTIEINTVDPELIFLKIVTVITKINVMNIISNNTL